MQLQRCFFWVPVFAGIVKLTISVRRPAFGVVFFVLMIRSRMASNIDFVDETEAVCFRITDNNFTLGRSPAGLNRSRVELFECDPCGIREM